MKFALAILVYGLMGLVLCAGILELIHGKPWLFVGGLLAYVIAFGWIGCRAH